MRDPYYGHRDSFTGDPDGDKDEKTEWDYALMSAYQVIEDHTGSNGILIWENEADNIQVEAIRKTDKFEQARQSVVGKKNYKPSKGEVFVPNVKKNFGEWPTYSEWVKSQVDDDDGTIE